MGHRKEPEQRFWGQKEHGMGFLMAWFSWQELEWMRPYTAASNGLFGAPHETLPVMHGSWWGNQRVKVWSKNETSSEREDEQKERGWKLNKDRVAIGGQPPRLCWPPGLCGGAAGGLQATGAGRSPGAQSVGLSSV